MRLPKEDKTTEKENLIKMLKKVIITGKTYNEYIADLANYLLTNFDIVRKNKRGGKIEYRAESAERGENESKRLF